MVLERDERDKGMDELRNEKLKKKKTQDELILTEQKYSM